MADESVDKELNIKEFKGINTALPEGEPNKTPDPNPIKEAAKTKITSTDEFILPETPQEDVLSGLTSSTLSSERTNRIKGTSFTYDKETSDAIKGLYTPFDLAKAIPDANERDEYIRQHGSKMVELLQGGKKVYGITFADQIKDYYGFRKNGYDRQLKKFVDDLDEAQGSFEAFFTGMGKWASKTLNSVTSLVPLVYGIGSALVNWDATKLFDNTLFDQWEKHDQWIDSRMVVYGGYDYHQLDENGNPKGFFARMADNPMKSLADDVAPMAAFVSGAILTEVAAGALAVPTGGASFAANTARLGAQFTRQFSKAVRATRGLDTLSDMDKMRKLVMATQNWRKGLGLATSMVRTAGYESALIARGTQTQTKNKAIYNYIASGQQPGLERRYKELVAQNSDEFGNLLISEQEIIDQIEQDLPTAIKTRIQNNADNAAELAWGLNIPLVGVSNMLQFPKVFNSSYRIGQGVIGRRLARLNPLVGTKMVGGEMVSRAAGRNFATKAYGYITPALIKGFTEAGEEFSQGVIEEGFSDYWSAEFNPKSVEASLSFLQSINSTAKKYYKSVEGEDSMLMGFLMGLVGMPLPVNIGVDAKTGKQTLKLSLPKMYGGVFEAVSEINSKIEKAERQSSLYNNITTNDVLKHNLENALKGMTIQSELDKALEEGNIFEYKNKEFENLHSFVENRYNNEIADTIFQDLDALDEMSLSDFNETYAFKDQEFKYTEEQKEKIIETARENAKASIASIEETEAFFNDERVFVDKLFNNKFVDKIVKSDQFLLNKYLGKQNIDDTLEDFAENLTFEDGTPINLTEEQKYEVKESQRKILKSQFALLNASAKNLEKREGELTDALKAELPNGGLSSLLNDANYVRFVTGIETKTLKDSKGNDVDITRMTFRDAKQKAALATRLIVADIKENNPEAYKFNGKKIDKLVADIFKIKQRKAKTASLYETLFSQKGATRFLTLKNNLKVEYSRNLLKLIELQAKERIDNAKSTATIDAQEEQANELENLNNETGKEIKSYLEEKQIEDLKELIDTLNLLVSKNPNIDVSKYTDAFNAYYDLSPKEVVKLLESYPRVFKIIKDNLGNKTPGLTDWDSIPSLKKIEKAILQNEKANSIEELIRDTFLDILKNYNKGKIVSNNIKNENPEENNSNTITPPFEQIPNEQVLDALDSLLNSTNLEWETGGAVLAELIINILHDKKMVLQKIDINGKPYTDPKTQTPAEITLKNGETRIKRQYFPERSADGKLVQKGGTKDGQNNDFITKSLGEEFDLSKVNDANTLTNDFLENNNVTVKFKIAPNEFGDKNKYNAQQIAINIYYSIPGGKDLFVGQLPATQDTKGELKTKINSQGEEVVDRQIPSFIELREQLYKAPVDDKGFLIQETTSNTIDNYVGYEATVTPKTETTKDPITEEEVIAVPLPRTLFADRIDRIKEVISGKRNAKFSGQEGNMVVIPVLNTGNEKDSRGRFMDNGSEVYLTKEENSELKKIEAKFKMKFITSSQKLDAKNKLAEKIYKRALETYDVIEDAPILPIKERLEAFKTKAALEQTTSPEIELARVEEIEGGFVVVDPMNPPGEGESYNPMPKEEAIRQVEELNKDRKQTTPQTTTPETEVQKDNINTLMKSKSISEIIKNFTNTNLDLAGKENLLKGDLEYLLTSYGKTKEDVKEFMKTQGSTLIKEVYRKDEKGFFKMLDALEQNTTLETEVEQIAISLGTSIDKQIGEGGMGTAFKLKNGKVLKTTRDSKEAKLAAELVKNPVAGLARYESVNSIDNDTTALVMEELEMLSEQEQKWVTSRMRSPLFSKNNILMYENTTNPKAIAYFTSEDINLDLSEPLPQTIIEQWNENKLSKEEKEFWESLSDQNYTDIINAIESFKLDGSELRGDNAGKNKKGDLVLFDQYRIEDTIDSTKKWLKNNITSLAVKTSEVETQIEQSVREKVIENNFQEIIKQLENNQIIDGENFVGQKRDCK